MPAPVYGSTVSIAAGTTSASQALSAAGIVANVIGITNTGPGLVFVRFTKGASTATLADVPIVASTAGTIFIPKPAGFDTASAIMASGSATVYFTAYEGLAYQ